MDAAFAARRMLQRHAGSQNAVERGFWRLLQIDIGPVERPGESPIPMFRNGFLIRATGMIVKRLLFTYSGPPARMSHEIHLNITRTSLVRKAFA
jgi:hypothetical protein